MRANLLSWQRGLYDGGHRSRTNLAIHVVTVPLFQLGTIAVLATPFVGTIGLVGLGGMLAALAGQGRGHKGEAQAPVPFDGPGDFVTRFFAEQWVTFPRFVLDGGFSRAWAAAAG